METATPTAPVLPEGTLHFDTSFIPGEHYQRSTDIGWFGQPMYDHDVYVVRARNADTVVVQHVATYVEYLDADGNLAFREKLNELPPTGGDIFYERIRYADDGVEFIKLKWGGILLYADHWAPTGKPAHAARLAVHS